MGLQRRILGLSGDGRREQDSERAYVAGRKLAGLTKQAARSGDSNAALFVNSVGKAFRVLSVFDARRQSLSLSQISTHSGLDLSATQRFVSTLMQLGLLLRKEQTKQYSLSPRMLDFARQYIAGNAFVALASPFLQQLSRETEETVNITVLDGTEVVVLQRIVSRHVLTPDVIVGTRMPVYCTSSGLAILAALPLAEAAAILDASELVRHTQFTIADRDEILARLGAIREAGYAHTEEELYLGDIATAVAVRAATAGRSARSTPRFRAPAGKVSRTNTGSRLCCSMRAGRSPDASRRKCKTPAFRASRLAGGKGVARARGRWWPPGGREAKRDRRMRRTADKVRRLLEVAGIKPVGGSMRPAQRNRRCPDGRCHLLGRAAVRAERRGRRVSMKRHGSAARYARVSSWECTACRVSMR